MCFEEKFRGIQEEQCFKIHLNAALNHSFLRRGGGAEVNDQTHTHTHTHTYKVSSSPPSTQHLLCTEQMGAEMASSVSCPLKETPSHAVPGHSGCGWLLGGEDVASSKVKSNFVSRKFHFHFLLPPFHSATLTHEDKSNTLA